MGGHDRDRQLERILAEVRAQQPPPISVERIRRHLAAAFAEASTKASWASGHPHERGRGEWRRWAGWAAAAAVVLGIAVAQPWRHPEAPGVPAPAPRAELSASSAGRGDSTVSSVLEATDVPRHVEHPGHARWSLRPGSRARLLPARAGVVRVELERGVLDAEVEPSERTESFVVVALGTEVAVHGTRFEVAIDGTEVDVAVAEGEVRVRPVGAEAGAMLVAGMRGRFADGRPVRELAANTLETGSAPAAAAARRVARNPGAPAKNRAPAAEAAAEASEAVTRTATGPAAPNSESAAGSEPAAAVSAATLEHAANLAAARIQKCFRRHTERRGELSIQATTRLSLWVQPNGLAFEVRLSPPLAPPVEHCVATELARSNLGETSEGFRLERDIHLGL